MTYPPWHVGPARQSPEPAAARGRPPRRRAAAHPGGRRLGKDACSHPSHRTPPRAGGGAVADPRRHVHQQGGRRAARAGGEAGRPGRGPALGRDLPCRRSAHPPSRGGGAGADAQLRHLRRRGPARGGEAGDQRSGLRRGHRPAAPGAHRSLEECGPAARRGAGRGVRRARQDGAQGVRAIPGRAAGLQCGRLRRPDRARDRAVPEARRHPPGLRRPLPPYPGGRVPGHQPRPVPAPAPARLRPREPGRGRRRRPVHLPLARRGGGQHPRFPQALPRHPGGAAGAELPQLGAHPGRRARHHREERAPRREEAVDRGRRGGESARRPRRGRARRGRPHRLRAVRGERAGDGLFRDGRLLPRQRAIARAGRRAARAASALPGGTGAIVLRPRRSQGHRRVSTTLPEPALGRRSLAGDQHAASRHRRHHGRAPARLGKPAGPFHLGGAQLQRSGDAVECPGEGRAVQGVDRRAAERSGAGRRRR